MNAHLYWRIQQACDWVMKKNIKFNFQYENKPFMGKIWVFQVGGPKLKSLQGQWGVSPCIIMQINQNNIFFKCWKSRQQHTFS